jgi:hypothetical protein
VVALLVGLVAAALADVVRLEVTPERLVAGQIGMASVVVLSDGGAPMVEAPTPPRLPAAPGLHVTFAGQTQQYMNRNGRVSRVRRFQYEVAAMEPGSWLVGPVELRLQDGTTVMAPPVRVQVDARDASAAPGEEGPVLEAGFDTDRAWEGEVVVYTYRLTMQGRGGMVEWRLPEFTGLRVPRYGEPIERSFEVADPDGTITVHEGVVPLVAVGAGRHDHRAATAAVRVPLSMSDLLGSRRLTAPEIYVGSAAPLETRALPPPPPGFTGIVGDVTVTSTVDATNAAVGSSVPWTIRIQGDAALDAVTVPPYTTDGVSVYDDDTTVQARIDGSVFVATGEVRRVLVPTAEGTLDLPDATLVTFSPTEGRYVTHTLPMPSIAVTAGKEDAASALQRFGSPGVKVAADDAPLAPRPPYATGRATVVPLLPWLAPLLGVGALPGLALLIGEGLERVRAFAARRRESRTALPDARQILARLPEDQETRLAALDHALRLLEIRVPGDPELRELRRRLGRARFGAGVPDPDLAADLDAAARRVEGERAA